MAQPQHDLETLQAFRKALIDINNTEQFWPILCGETANNEGPIERRWCFLLYETDEAIRQAALKKKFRK